MNPQGQSALNRVQSGMNLEKQERYPTTNIPLWRQNTVTLGKNTNNRLEVSWKQLKEWVGSFMAVGQCITPFLYYQVYKRGCLLLKYPKMSMSSIYTYALGPASYTLYEGCPGVYLSRVHRRMMAHSTN
ncbi:hypothetical protein PHPALM_11514 [Phytophthora palmivora]|uniref:Uncharacterized protein n=1 Tax=Phytophthora palmivora TaxID=4796 RepID=A0A2P4Y220_9STRA|nr:hypothetical protein PHPALM_11514 [Phytophthora palmivora]